MKMIALVLGGVLLGGCSTMGGAAAPIDKISFDRGAFALAYADFTHAVRLKCDKKPNTAECVKFDTLDQQVRAQITAPPPPPSQSNPLDALLPLIMKLAPLALAL